MNTLQLYISKSSRESAQLAEINPSDEGRRAAADMKGAVALINYPPSAKTVFLIVTNLSNGYAVHIIRTIPPTKPNHLDATIYVDKNLDIMAEDLIETIQSVSETVLAKAVTEDDMARLRRLFAKEYDTRDKAPRIKPSKGSEYAFLSYGGDNPDLSEIIVDGLYRPEWSAYRAVCLLEYQLLPLPNSMADLNASDEEEPYDEVIESDPRPAIEGAAHSTPTTYVFSIPVILPDGKSELEFELESNRQIQRSPVAGYAVAGRIASGPDRINRLRQSIDKSLYSRFEKWIWGVGGVVVGIIFTAIVGLFSSSDDKHRVDTYQPRPAVESDSEVVALADEAPVSSENKSEKTVAAAQQVQTEAIAYLDNNKIWRLDQMEKIEGLRGLFDDLNNFRFDQITGKWAQTLDASKSFKKVVKAAEKSISKKVDPRRDPGHNPTYNREGDNGISWLTYTFWIDP